MLMWLSECYSRYVQCIHFACLQYIICCCCCFSLFFPFFPFLSYIFLSMTYIVDGISKAHISTSSILFVRVFGCVVLYTYLSLECIFRCLALLGLFILLQKHIHRVYVEKDVNSHSFTISSIMMLLMMIWSFVYDFFVFFLFIYFFIPLLSAIVIVFPVGLTSSLVLSLFVD